MTTFNVFQEAVYSKIKEMTGNNNVLFVTDVSKDVLWDVYLNSYPEGTNEIYKTRREYDCNCCKQFIRACANMVEIKDNKLISIWDVDVPYPFNKVAEALSKTVKSALVTNKFMSIFSKVGTKSNHQQLEDESVKTWNHFYCELPSKFVTKNDISVESVQGSFRDNKNVFKRSMEELSLESGLTILELIEQGSLYRGDEHKKSINEFVSYKRKYEKLTDNEKDNWCWINSIENHVSKIRNTAVGTLLIDLSEGVEIDIAVSKFEKVMAPTNYKRPTAIITTKMIAEAEKTIQSLGLENSLGRRFAVPEDLTVNNVLFVNRETKKKLKSSILSDLKEEVSVNPKKFNKVEEVSIEDFISNILPTSTNIELMMENNHKSNLMSLIAPQDKDAPSILKWNNNFSWSYNGDITDSMKENVKNAGGKVDGVLRFSIQWNDGTTHNSNDFDAHCIEPNGNKIYFANSYSRTGGTLDVDIRRPIKGKPAVENITWPSKNTMLEGKYQFIVYNFSMIDSKEGFNAEIEYDGQIYSYSYSKPLSSRQCILVAEVEFSKTNGLKFIKSLDSTTSSKEIWGVNTNKFTKVSMLMFSPNYWDDQVGIGNKHYFFILDKCKNESTPRGFFNEFLHNDLMKHKRVFEALGSKMRVEDSDNQLSGLGFSTTQRNSIIAKVDGTITRTIKINF